MKFPGIGAMAIAACVLAYGVSGALAAESRAAQKSTLTPTKAVVPSLPKAPQCAPGFEVKNKHLNTSGGKSWYEYQCVRRDNIYRFCNSGLTVLGPKNSFTNLAGTPGQVNSVLRMSYVCAKPEG